MVVAIVVVAVAKPWATSRSVTAPGPSALPSAKASHAAGPVTSPRASEQPLTVTCLTPDTWRVIGQEHEPTLDTRRWLGVAPVAADGPLAADLPHVRVSGFDLAGLGFCLPQAIPTIGQPAIYQLSTDGERATALAGPLVPLPASGVSSVELFLPPVLRVVTSGTRKAQLFEAPDGDAVWPPGSYVVNVHVASRTSAAFWFVVDVAAAPLAP